MENHPTVEYWHSARASFSSPQDANTFWRSKKRFFQEHGYILDLQPEGFTSPVQNHADGHGKVDPRTDTQHESFSVIKATRMADGSQVCIKRVGILSDEFIGLMSLQKGVKRADPGNHSVYIYETLPDEERRDVSYMVMPALRPVCVSTIRTVGDLVDLVSQVLMGMCFLHRNKIAHCDCSLHNIMMDEEVIRTEKNYFATLPEAIYPSSSQLEGKQPQLASTPTTRTYYFVGFGGAKRLTSYTNNTSRQHAKDQEPPEFHNRLCSSYDPLLLDIFLIGNMFRREFLDKYSNIGFLTSLIKDMVHDQPTNRVDASGALHIWLELLPRISPRHRKRRLHDRSKWRVDTFVPKVLSITRRMTRASNGSDGNVVPPDYLLSK
ncbi:hypothetical protein BDY19DRAFT_1071710 [Irpex rosettiformis]|uniref:Uncharacterized protein n=1 Tax=Irpex rosettiformis TaxID=378272 RepID=A0ACB8U2Z6_9APHY|nr:hypothetical protein BDY19DRAFT_1071710 [Irpex rosettiformis]